MKVGLFDFQKDAQENLYVKIKEAKKTVIRR